MLETLWERALQNYKTTTGNNPQSHPLAQQLTGQGDLTAEKILSLFEGELQKLKKFRADDSKWGKIRNTYLKPALTVILRLNDGFAASVRSPKFESHF